MWPPSPPSAQHLQLWAAVLPSSPRLLSGQAFPGARLADLHGVGDVVPPPPDAPSPDLHTVTCCRCSGRLRGVVIVSTGRLCGALPAPEGGCPVWAGWTSGVCGPAHCVPRLELLKEVWVPGFSLLAKEELPMFRETSERQGLAAGGPCTCEIQTTHRTPDGDSRALANPGTAVRCKCLMEEAG